MHHTYNKIPLTEGKWDHAQLRRLTRVYPVKRTIGKSEAFSRSNVEQMTTGTGWTEIKTKSKR